MLPALLADFTPLDGSFQGNVYSLLVLLSVVVGLWLATRRKPPLDTHLVKLETAIGELQRAVESLTVEQKRHIAHEAKIAELEDKVRSLESRRENDASNQRSYLAKTVREIFDRIESESRITQEKLDATSSTIAANFQAVERALGRLDGAIELVRDRLNQS